MNDNTKNPQYSTNANPYQNQMIKKPWNQNKESVENVYGRPNANQATPKKQQQAITQ